MDKHSSNNINRTIIQSYQVFNSILKTLAKNETKHYYASFMERFELDVHLRWFREHSKETFQ